MFYLLPVIVVFIVRLVMYPLFVYNRVGGVKVERARIECDRSWVREPRSGQTKD